MFSPEELQEIKLFLGLLYPWDDEGEGLFKSVSWTFVGKEGDLDFANYAAQKLDDLVRLIQSRARRPAANTYVCLATQRLASVETVTADGFPKARRHKNNLVSYNSVAMDLDVKPGAYATTEDAFAALDDFVKVTGLPTPTMEVLSGSGGVHVYWCFDKPVPLVNWVPIATALQAAGLGYKLKFDPAVTVNQVGILRVPNTWNHKSNPPKKVRLVREPGHTFPRYSYQQMAGALAKWTGANNVKQGTITPNFKNDNSRTSNFTEGVGTAPPVSIDDVAVNCMAIDDILERGGAGDQEPLWNLALYAASFTSDPHDAAHRLSSLDSRYTYDGTEKKLLEKITARQGNPDAGWPTCKSFSTESAKCAICPLFSQGKTPFHHVVRQQQADEPAQFLSNDPLMPDGFWRNKNNHVMTTVYKKNGEAQTVDVTGYPFLDGGIDPTTGDLCFKVVIAGIPQWRPINVGMNMQPAQAASALAIGLNGVVIPARNHSAVRDFLVAWLKHLQTTKRVANQSAYGWLGTAFAFDDKIYHETKVETVYRGKNHDANFTTAGELKPWQDAMQLVYQNLPLETVVASAFAAPLVELVGSSSLVLSCYSQHSGIGKSTAMMLAQSVWGNPRSGMSTLSDTTNSMMKKITDLKSLPVYWDELRTKDQLEKVIDIVFQVTQGKGKARLNKDTTQMAAPAFTTMFVVASNHGIADTVFSQTESTEAGGLRLFEIEPVPVPTVMSNYEANQLVIKLASNYGVVGSQYAQWLAENRKLVIITLKAISDQMHQVHGFAPKERFWQMTMSTLLTGAMLANHCGLARFDIAGLNQFLGLMLARQRRGMKAQEYATMAATRDVTGLLQEMISETRGKNLIITETIPYATIGRPTPNNLVDTDLSRLGDVWIQIGDKDGRIRVRVRPFKEWLMKRSLSPTQIIETLRADYVVTQSKQTIGAGVAGLDALARIGQFECFDLTPKPKASSPAPSHGSDVLH